MNPPECCLYVSPGVEQHLDHLRMAICGGGVERSVPLLLLACCLFVSTGVDQNFDHLRMAILGGDVERSGTFLCFSLFVSPRAEHRILTTPG